MMFNFRGLTRQRESADATEMLADQMTAALGRISLSVQNTPSLQELLATIAYEMRELFGAELAILRPAIDDSDQSDQPGQIQAAISLADDLYSIPWLPRLRRSFRLPRPTDPGSAPVILANLRERRPAELIQREFDALMAAHVTWLLSVPLMQGDRLVARLDLARCSDTPFTVTDQNRCTAIADTLAMLLVASPACTGLTGQIVPVDHHASTFPVNAIADVGEMVQNIVEWVAEVGGNTRCVGLLWNSDRQAYLPVATTGASTSTVEALKSINLSPGSIPALCIVEEHHDVLYIPAEEIGELLPARMSDELELGSVTLMPLVGSTGTMLGIMLLDTPVSGTPLSAGILNTLRENQEQLAVLLENALLYERVRRNSDNLEIVNDIGIDLSSLSDLDSLFARLHHHVCAVFDASRFAMGLLLPRHEGIQYRYALEDRIAPEPVDCELDEHPLLRVLGTREGLIKTNLKDAEGAGETWFPMKPDLPAPRSVMVVPVVVGRQSIGVLTIQSESYDAYTSDQLRLFTTLGMQMGVAIQNTRLYAIVQQRGEQRGFVLDQVMTQQEVERKSLVDDLHNDTLQMMANSLLRLDITSRSIGTVDAEEAKEKIMEVRDEIATNIERLRDVVFRLRPSSLDILGLEAAIREHFRQFEADTGISTTLEVDLEERLENDREATIYRFVQDAVAAVRDRDGLHRVAVRLRRREDDDEVVITVGYDGAGFDTRVLDTSIPTTPESDIEVRLLTLRERVDLAGGQLIVTSRRDRGGGVVQASIPVRSQS